MHQRNSKHYFVQHLNRQHRTLRITIFIPSEWFDYLLSSPCKLFSSSFLHYKAARTPRRLAHDALKARFQCILTASWATLEVESWASRERVFSWFSRTSRRLAHDALKTDRFARSRGQRGKHNCQTECEDKPFFRHLLCWRRWIVFVKNTYCWTSPV